MTSSMLTGERRWASARRGGMTVLGKVAVPKPINLPSQRLENHGLDPNVDIVPKGTHSWGTRSSPSTTNPWGSSNTPSPNNDGTGSPSYLSGRPSSGGSGTRPSTAGSDRAQEPNSNAWGSNSRPSSASGTLTSSQSSLASLRPRSAETRPGSSQLSRFAEPSTDSSVAWGANRTAEKMGMTSAKNDGFSLTTGDFPTLGSEKEISGKSTESQDHGSHGRPSSSSGGAALAKEMTGNFVGSDDGNSNIRNETWNSWRRENHMYCEDGTRNSAEKWHQDHQPYPNSNIPHQQYDAWRGPPVNSHPGGVWYRGPPPPGGPPFGAPVGPGGFPMEPFPYYRPQIPPGALTNAPPPGAGPRGPRPKNGDMYRPHMLDAYMRPGVPIRPGFYPGPVPYDGYYGPPMGYCGSNERDIPFMGMPMGPAAYNPYPGQNVPDPGNSRGRAHGPSSKGLVSEQMESFHPQDARGPYKVLLKQHDGWEGRDEQKWDENATVPFPGKGDLSKKSWENGWRGHHSEVEMDSRRTIIHEEGLSESSDNRGSDSSKVPEDAGQLKASDDSSVKDKEQAEPVVVVPSKVSPVPREPSLIQKIEGLNAKARASDGRQDVLSVSGREEQRKKIQANDGKKNASVSEAAAVSESFGTPDLNTSSNEGGISTGGKSVDSMVFGGTTTSRKPTHGMHGGADRRGKGRFNAQETDGWRKIPQAKEPPILVSPAVPIESSVVQGIDSTSARAIEKPGAHSQLKNGEPSPLVSDPSDSQSQRARMTELVKQRFKQREKEEEEREREQRAKAQAKLEELNRRTLAGEVSSHKQDSVPNSAVGKKREEPSAHVQHTAVGSKSKGHNSVLGPSPSAVAPSSESSAKGAEISTSLSRNVLQGTTNTVHKEVHGNSVPVQQEANNSSSVHHENDPHAHDIGASKQKRYRQKQQSSVEKNSSEKSTASTTELSKGDASVVTNAAVSPESVVHNNVLNCESSLPVNQGVVSESSLHHKRKNRSSKSKHKVEEATYNASLSKDASASDIVVESKKATDAKLTQDPGPVQPTIDSKDASQPLDQSSILPNEEVHARASNQWKSQHPRKPLRNSHPGKSSEKFQNTDAVFWAPVRSHKNEVSDEANQTPADVVSPSEKNEQQVPNNPRSKRAEMERYVPKPAVKEMSQQGSTHQSVTSSNNQTISDDSVGKSESFPPGTENSQTSSPVAEKVGSTVEYRHGDSHSRQNKSGKAHGAWRQRASAESSTATSNTNRNVQKPTEHQQQKPHSSLVKEHSRHTDDWGICDGWNIPEKSDAPVNAPVAKEQGMVVKGKRYKSTGYSHHPDEKRVNSGISEKVSVQHSSVPEMKQSQLHATSKENRPVGDRSGSHWQPKASAFVVTNEQGSRSNDGHDVIAEVNTGNKKDSTPPQQNKESNVPKSQHYQHVNVEEAQGVAHQESKRVRKIDVHDRRPVSPVDPSSSNMGARHEQRGSSGFRKNGNQNFRFGREHEHNGDWSGSAKDGKQHNAPAQREKQRQSSHYEYQPVGPESSVADSSTVPTKDGSRNAYGRYKERGQAHPRRGGGNFNGRQTGNVRADASYE